MTTQPVSFQTERLSLRPFSFGDVDDIVTYAGNPEVSRFIPSIPRPYGRRQAEEYLSRLTLMEWDSRPTFAILQSDRVIGAIDLNVRAAHGTAELGFVFGHEHWGQGLATEAGRAMLGYGFGRLGLTLLTARSDIRNKASHAVLRKLGMEQEGVLRGRVVQHGERLDVAHFSLFKGEWMAALKARQS